MPEYVYLNNKLVPAEKAKISVYDHGFLYGDGIFETMRAYGGKVFCQEEHLERLFNSANLICLKIPWSKAELAKAICATIERNQLASAYVRLTVSRGKGPLGLDPRLCPEPTLVIMARPFISKQEIYEAGVKVITVETRRIPSKAVNPEIKSMNFLNNILAKIETISTGAFEGIMLNYEGWITEGTVSNIFIINGKHLLTPSADSGILIGVTRNTVIGLAANLGLLVKETLLAQDDLYQSEEVFLTNSSGEVIPVVQVDDQVIGSGKPGSKTLELLKGYGQLVHQNLL